VFAVAQIVAPFLSMLLFVAVGLDLRASDFARLRREPLLVGIGVIAPLVLLPAIAVFLCSAAGLPDTVRAGLLLVAISPIGGFSTIYSYIAHASPALSVTLTTFSAVLAPLTIPLLSGVVSAGSASIQLSAPIGTIGTYVITAILLPIIAGMWIRMKRPAAAARYRPQLNQLATIGVVVLTIAIIADDVSGFGAAARDAGVVVTLYCISCFAVGGVIGTLTTADPRDRFTIATEFTARNAGVAIALALNVLGRIDLARYAILYIVLEAPVLLIAAVVFRRYFLPRAVVAPVTAVTNG
jgi:bile acid:Na+ symporter, BASS family